MFDRFLNAVTANRAATIGGAALAVVSLGGSRLIGLPPAFMLILLIAFALVTWGVYRWRSRAMVNRPAAVPIRSVLSSAAIAVLVVFAAAQAVPYGRAHSNPPVTGEPDWATAETRALMVRACFDCHSNEVEWPWYSNIAPISWALTKHVDDGRSKVNYSEWDRPQRDADESFEEVEKGSMPPGYYTLGGLHADAKLTDEEMSTLLAGLQATPGLSD